MNGFVQQFGRLVTGVLSGLDRVRFRGTLRRIANTQGVTTWLQYLRVPFREFKEFADDLTGRLVARSLDLAESAGRPVRYLESSATNKEEVARQIAEADGIEAGLVCVLTCVEPCRSFMIRRDAQSGKPRFHCGLRKCKHVYHYWIHPELGWMHTRLQSWLPFNFWICINGREWLARQLDREGMGYQRRGNCFTALEDPQAAQEVMDCQLRTSWPPLLSSIAALANPGHEEVFAQYPLRHYWSAEETEWASDVMFCSPGTLAGLYPKLTRYAISVMSSPDVMRFLGRQVGERVNGQFTGQLVSDLRTRPEGVRIKHRMNSNSIKMYDKAGSVLRVETTINDSRQFKTYRRPEGQPEAEPRWLPMRKGVADLHRRAKISQTANERYFTALSAADVEQTLDELVRPICRRVIYRGRGVRALNPMSVDDQALLKAVASGEFTLNGFRNRDIRRLLFGETADDSLRTKQSAVVSRKLRMLLAHRLIRRVPKTHRYVLTARGVRAISALLQAQAAQPRKLAAAA